MFSGLIPECKARGKKGSRRETVAMATTAIEPSIIVTAIP